jgi:hypothetical protein
MEKDNKEICGNCGGQGWTAETEYECCGNYAGYECCGVPVPIQVQVQCECEINTFKEIKKENKTINWR